MRSRKNVRRASPAVDRPPPLHGLAPVHDADTRILILGSFPSEASLRARQYYGHPRNQFWRLLGGVIGEPLQELSYAERLARVRAHRFGIWDVIASCERQGSLDSAIRDAAVNDFAALFGCSPRICRIAFNGGKAASYRRLLAPLGKEMSILPSSSPANASWSFERKQAAWIECLRQAEEWIAGEEK